MRIKRIWQVTVGLLLSFLAGVSFTVQAQESTLRAAMQASDSSSKQGARVQAQIDRLADETTELFAEYRLAAQSLDRLTVYNEHLQALVDDQEKEKSTFNKKLEDAAVVQQEIVPLMNDMIKRLGEFIELDMPIDINDRQRNHQKLLDLMPDSSVTTAEKYRQIMIAYKSEMDLGRKISTYSGSLPKPDGSSQKVNFLQVGRILLAYQTEDRTETGFWDKTKSPANWSVLPAEYRDHIDYAMRIANKQAAPNLLRLPLPAPEVAQ